MIISGKTKNKKKFFVQNTDGDILLKDHAILWVGYNVLQQNTRKRLL
jgi:hypothetical protein